METEIKILPAYHGDCIIIQTHLTENQEITILIDGGTGKTYDRSLKKELRDLKLLDLLIVTHIDSDHIAGIIRFIRSSLFKKIEIRKFWINAANLARVSSESDISFNQGVTIEKLLVQKDVPLSKIDSYIHQGATLALDPKIEIVVLSPSKTILDELYLRWPELLVDIEHKSITQTNISADSTSQISRGSLEALSKNPFHPEKSINVDIFNSSSLAFIIELNYKKILLLGDSRPEIICDTLTKLGYTKQNKLKVELTKISHHGSKNNTSCALLDLIECDHFIISTNGGNARSKHPDRETIARIIYHPERNFSKKRTIYFNYPFSLVNERAGQVIEADDFHNGNWEISELTIIKL